MAKKKKLEIYEILLLEPEEASKLLLEEISKEIPDLRLIEDIIAYTSVDVNARDEYGWTALINAAYNSGFMRFVNTKSIIELLLNHPKIDVNARDDGGETALFKASGRGDSKCIKLFLNRSDINVNLKNKIGSTALMYAADNHNIEAVKLFLNYPGIDLYARNQWDKTAYDYGNIGDAVIAKLIKPYMRE
jgi:ankyrin repeat protein